MDIAARIQQLEDVIREAKSMPLSASALVNREEALEVLAQMREELPEEIKQARWVVKDREELLAKGRREAESLVERARAEQTRLASEQAVVQKANEEAERILAEARDASRQSRLEAEDYVDGKLAQFEIALQKVGEAIVASQAALERTLESVHRGREKLRGVSHAERELAPEQAGPEGDGPMPEGGPPAPVGIFDDAEGAP
jgi:cell division septum initiation protein DivIVA